MMTSKKLWETVEQVLRREGFTPVRPFLGSMYLIRACYDLQLVIHGGRIFYATSDDNFGQWTYVGVTQLEQVLRSLTVDKDRMY